MEVRCDSAKELSSKFHETCFADPCIDTGMSELMDVMRSEIAPITPATNYIALGRDINQMMKKCAEFPTIYEQYTHEREERLTRVRTSIEEEKKRLDGEYRQRAQEMKRACQVQLDSLENTYRASYV
ncbi:hypothetical protein JH06_2771 [Blastocystis sp. subtype 4]|uniref:hypothetical protein n=1 Tax=Blastocystis sp. subtype 4 TaxID=944170 RepID=UPI0007120C31|nr:hypothetical protein JH06_2771 [Blastocystis sp. subtype 4]KNB43406.1 hypothetical protein JH06_2771 [Blastocystis sp. subtype 4]|eukprot:XP_014526849.1 hypothetical protein JH06_2771 [Blastocystis sp. subtype 4]